MSIVAKIPRNVPTNNAQGALLRYLIPDLTNLVLEYCWTKKDKGLEKACFHGNYEGISTYFAMIIKNFGSFASTASRKFNFGNALRGACHGGHLKIVQLVICNHEQILKTSEHHTWIMWERGYKGAMDGGYNDIIQYILYHSVTGIDMLGFK